MTTQPQAQKTVWIVGYYGHVPAEAQRDYRALLLAKALADRGYLVKWWIANFNHTTKKFRVLEDAISGVEGVDIEFVPVSPYSSNVSLGRILSEHAFGRAFEVLALRGPAPFTVILLEPARFYGNAVARVARKTGARLVLDILDLWPEFFEMLFPRPFRKLARAFLWPLYRQRDGLVRQAAGIVGVAADYVREVLARNRFAGPQHVAYIGSPSTLVTTPTPSDAILDSPDKEQLLIAYVGALGNGYDLQTVVAAARKLKDRNIRWMIAGAGPFESEMRRAATELGHERFVYLGLQPAVVIDRVLQRADIGLCSYKEGSTVSMPLKAYDYLAHGIPLISSLDRQLGRLVAEEGIGLPYKAGDVDSLVSAIERLASDSALRRQCGERAMALGRRFDSASQHREYVDFLISNNLVPA